MCIARKRKGQGDRRTAPHTPECLRSGLGLGKGRKVGAPPKWKQQPGEGSGGLFSRRDCMGDGGLCAWPFCAWVGMGDICVSKINEAQ